MDVLPVFNSSKFGCWTYLKVAYPSGQYSNSGQASPEIPLKHLKMVFSIEKWRPKCYQRTNV